MAEKLNQVPKWLHTRIEALLKHVVFERLFEANKQGVVPQDNCYITLNYNTTL